MRRILASAGEFRVSVGLLTVAMAVSATWMLIAGNGLTFTNDDFFYFAEYIVHGFSEIEPSGGTPEYFLAPSNGHFQLGGKLIYRAVFETFGANYFVLRAIEVGGLIVCVGLFFHLARQRVRPLAALAASVSLLFLGFAWEAFLWAFDMHTTYSLAFGLGAVIAVQRRDRTGDLLACVLLVLSVAMIELGLAFAAGIAVAVALERDRLRRAWIVVVPLAIYAAWWVWSRSFDQGAATLSNVKLIPITITEALAAVLGSIFGINPTGEGVFEPLVEPTAWASALAALATVGLVWRISRGGVPRTLWVFSAVVLAYWGLVAIGDRPPDSSRYIFVGALLVFLVAADALRGRSVPGKAVLAAFAVVALAIPANVAKLYDGRGPQLRDATNSQVEYAMVELAAERVAPDYAPGKDQRVLDAGGSVFTPLHADDYLEGAARFGTVGFPLERIRSEDLELRTIADASLSGALRVRLRPAAAPPEPRACPSSLDGTPEQSVFFQLSPGSTLLGSRSSRPVDVEVSRFARGEAGVPVGSIEPGTWAELSIPPDSASDPWMAIVNGAVFVCSVGR